MSKETGRCGECDEPFEDHCQYVPVFVPDKCVCDSRCWGNPFKIPPICSKFKDDALDPDYCKDCQHEEDCHK